ncbi:hypothetical protein D5086_011909 [Populus alba]|uniref:Uncharacterized protein n=1 Tax=Populus alba TaxID=43335 RepID=A0ACC4C1X9_POPAL
MSSHIPFDIITRILSNLDIKTLLCFRSVSKGWRSLIDSSGFINTHMSLSIKTNTNNTLLILGEGGLNPINFDDLSPWVVDVVIKEEERALGSSLCLNSLVPPDGMTSFFIRIQAQTVGQNQVNVKL